MRALTAASFRISPVARSDEHGDRHAPGALARDHPVRPVGDHAGDAVLALRPAPTGVVDRLERRLAQGPVAERDSTGRSMAMNHCGVLRKITGFFERQECGYWWRSTPAGDERPGLGQRGDDRLVGVALLALRRQHAGPGEARGRLGQHAVGIHRVGDGRVDAALAQQPAARHPEFEILAAVARRRVDEAGAGFVGDVVAVEHRHREIVAERRQGMGAGSGWRGLSGPTSPTRSNASTRAALNTVAAKLSASR